MNGLIRYGANFKVVGKTQAQNLSHPRAWPTVAGTLADLVKHINQGHPWMPVSASPPPARPQAVPNSDPYLSCQRLLAMTGKEIAF